MEKFCPSCSRAYEDSDLTHCELDGERLIVMQTEADLVGQELDGKYVVRAKLGEGGMGTVYVAEQRSMGREVAVKILRPRFSQNRQAIKYFLREARAASRLTHPNTITVYDSGQTPQGLLYQVMERLNGRPLNELLEAEGGLSVPRAIAILSQICDSLAEAHLAGITHRDLKPENIFIEPTVGNPEFVKVLDFGIAKIAEDSGTNATATGMICGTPSYMSPEQTMGRPLDGRSDIYALGVLLYETVVGERPFSGQTPMEIMLKQINEPPPGLPEGVGGIYAERLSAMLKRMMAKSVDARPPDCQTLKQELAAVLNPEAALAALPASERDTRVERPRQSVTNPTPVGRDASEFTGLSPAVDPSGVTEFDFKPSRWELRAAAVAAVILLAAGGAWVVWPSAASVESSAAEASAPASSTPLASAQPSPARAEQAPRTVRKVAAPGAPAADAEVPPAAEEAPALDAATSGSVAGVAVGQAALALAARDVEPAAQPVQVLVESTPAGATVTDAEGKELGITPFTHALPPGQPTLSVTFALDGHRSEKAVLDAATPNTWSVRLHRAPRKVIGSAAPKPGSKAPDAARKPPAKTGFGHGTF
ncbi:MAG: serine/threonine-protein kinase [Myxococcota bacterium]